MFVRKCLFKTQKPVQLRQHVESKQEGIIHFRCDYMNCTYGTDNIKSHRRHAKTHQNTKQDNIHKCNQCNFTFPRAISLKAHLKKPSWVKRYECNYCDYASCCSCRRFEDRLGNSRWGKITYEGNQWNLVTFLSLFFTSTQFLLNVRAHDFLFFE